MPAREREREIERERGREGGREGGREEKQSLQTIIRKARKQQNTGATSRTKRK